VAGAGRGGGVRAVHGTSWSETGRRSEAEMRAASRTR
jgi:hypothetical protein